MFRTYSVCVISVYTYIHRHSNRPARQLGRSRAGVTRRRARRPDGMRDGEDASRARSGRPCALCSTTKRNPRPKKVLKKCYDALDADVVLGPLLLDDRGGARGPVYCHQACALWCPEVYFDARTEKLRKLAEALRRARRIPCARCKGKGAAIGCAVEACPRSYHFACAHADGCAFVQGEFMLACPRHARRMASERADARWQDAGVEDAVEEGQGKGAGSGDGDGSNDRGVSGARDGSNGATAPVEAPPLAAPGATPILNRIRATAEISRGRKQKKRKRVKLADDKFMNTREGAIYRAVMEAGVRLNAEKEKSTGAIADDDEAFRLRESRRLDKDKELIPRVVIGGGLGTSTYSAGWESLAGMEEHVKTLKELTLLPLAYPEMFESLGAGAARGVLLHGPPGTGKTAAVRAMLGAAARGPRPISFFSRLGADCLGKYSGEAERKLRLLFEEAEKRQPSIIFFDEIDGLAPARRGGGGSGAQDEIHSSVVATLLALMDGLSGRGSVVVVASTNRPDAVDPALRRPGRFDRELFFGLPDAEARADILAVHTRAWTPRPSRETLEAVASRTEGCAGADLRAVANAALMSALKRTCPSLLSGDPTRDSLAVELEARLPPPESSKTALEEARVAHESGHAGAFLALKQFDALAMRVKVYWPLEDAHHEATIVGYDRNTVSHRLRYDDSNLFNGEDVWMQLFRPNVGLEVVPSDLEKHPVKATVRTRVRESLEDANDLLEKYRNSRRDGVSVSSRDWTHALSTTSNACSARSAAAALVPRGKPLESFLVPILGGSVRKVMSECFKRGAPMTPKCLSAASACADADVADTVVEDALIAAGAFERGSASIEDRDIVPLTHPSASGDDNSVRSGCRLLLAGESRLRPAGNRRRRAELFERNFNALDQSCIADIAWRWRRRARCGGCLTRASKASDANENDARDARLGLVGASGFHRWLRRRHRRHDDRALGSRAEHYCRLLRSTQRGRRWPVRRVVRQLAHGDASRSRSPLFRVRRRGDGCRTSVLRRPRQRVCRARGVRDRHRRRRVCIRRSAASRIREEDCLAARAEDAVPRRRRGRGNGERSRVRGASNPCQTRTRHRSRGDRKVRQRAPENAPIRSIFQPLRARWETHSTGVGSQNRRSESVRERSSRVRQSVEAPTRDARQHAQTDRVVGIQRGGHPRKLVPSRRRQALRRVRRDGRRIRRSLGVARQSLRLFPRRRRAPRDPR